MSKASQPDRVKNERVSQSVNEDRNILYKIKKRKAEWVGESLRSKTRYLRRDRGKDRSDGKTRKKT